MCVWHVVTQTPTLACRWEVQLAFGEGAWWAGAGGPQKRKLSGVLRPSDVSALERREQASQASWGPREGCRRASFCGCWRQNLSEPLTAPLRLYLGPGAGKRPLNRG